MKRLRDGRTLVALGAFWKVRAGERLKTPVQERPGWLLMTSTDEGATWRANVVAVAILDRRIEGAAVATAFSYIVVFMVTSGYALSMLLGRRTMATHVGGLLVVAAYVAAALWSIEALVGSGAGPLLSDAPTAGGKLMLFMVLMAPCLILAERRVRGLSRLRDVARTALAKARRR